VKAARRPELRHRILEGIDSLGDHMVEVILAEIPAYRALDAAQVAEVKAIAVWLLRQVIEAWAVDGDLSESDVGRLRAIGAARAADGRPLASVLRSYRVGSNAAMNRLIQQYEHLLTVPDVIALARVWLASFDRISEAVYEGYSESEARLTTDRDRAIRDLMEDLLAGRQSRPGAVADRSRALGVTLPEPAELVVIGQADGALGGAEHMGDHLAEQLRKALDAECDLLVSTRGERAVLLLPVQDEATLAAAVASIGCAGCAVRPASAAVIVDAYRLAALTLDLAPLDAYEQRPVLREADGYVVALLAGRPPVPAEAIARQLLGELVEPRHRHVLEGLEAFLSAGSAPGAAAQLGLHPQTLRYRLRRVRELTGRDTRRRWDRLCLEIGCRIARSTMRPE
jgi:hypothetical protein